MMFETRVEGDIKTTARAVQRYLNDYKDRNKSVALVLQCRDQSLIHVR